MLRRLLRRHRTELIVFTTSGDLAAAAITAARAVQDNDLQLGRITVDDHTGALTHAVLTRCLLIIGDDSLKQAADHFDHFRARALQRRGAQTAFTCLNGRPAAQTLARQFPDATRIQLELTWRAPGPANPTHPLRDWLTDQLTN